MYCVSVILGSFLKSYYYTLPLGILRSTFLPLVCPMQQLSCVCPSKQQLRWLKRSSLARAQVIEKTDHLRVCLCLPPICAFGSTRTTHHVANDSHTAAKWDHGQELSRVIGAIHATCDHVMVDVHAMCFSRLHAGATYSMCMTMQHNLQPHRRND